MAVSCTICTKTPRCISRKIIYMPSKGLGEIAVELNGIVFSLSSLESHCINSYKLPTDLLSYNLLVIFSIFLIIHKTWVHKPRCNTSILQSTQIEYGIHQNIPHQSQHALCANSIPLTFHWQSRLMHSANFGHPGGEPGAWQGCKRAGHTCKAKDAPNKGNSVLRNPVAHMVLSLQRFTCRAPDTLKVSSLSQGRGLSFGKSAYGAFYKDKTRVSGTGCFAFCFFSMALCTE